MKKNMWFDGSAALFPHCSIAGIGRPTHQGVKDQLERAMCLHPVLRPETDENDLAPAVLHRYHRRFLGNQRLADQPSALQKVAIHEGHDSLYTIVPFGRDDLVNMVVAQEQTQPFLGHAIGQWICVVDDHSERRAR